MHSATIFKTIAMATIVATAAVAMALPRSAFSADRMDAPATDPVATIGNVYTWMDGTNFIAAITVSPFADKSAQFSSSVQYVFHMTSSPGFAEQSAPLDLICTFDASQIISCWLGTDEYVTGDASKEAGITSEDGKLKVFAGLRADPFFFNLGGFNDGVAAITEALPVIGDQGCTFLDPGSIVALQGLFKEVPSNANPERTNPDDYVDALTLAIVISIDKSLVTKGGNLVSVWGATHQAQ
ncbi:MAG: DUF4331 domain-containing protein [Polyangiaceae bacterium]|nr:DUF4331 domain-containing protein [Polyangiaceae bacterium]